VLIKDATTSKNSPIYCTGGQQTVLTMPGSKDMKNMSIDDAMKLRMSNFNKMEQKSSLISKNYQTEHDNELNYSDGLMLPIQSNQNNLQDIPKMKFINQFVSYSKWSEFVIF
jgi:hypothetical protein